MGLRTKFNKADLESQNEYIFQTITIFSELSKVSTNTGFLIFHLIRLHHSASANIKWNHFTSLGSCTPPEQLGELLSRNFDGDWSACLYYELHHWEE